MADFNWHTEDDGWDDEPAPVEKSERPSRRLWLRIGIGLLLVAILGIVIYSQIRRQIDAAVQRAEDEVRQTHELVLQAADEGDRDLLNNLVSARNSEWLNQQLAVTEERLLFNPRSFGLVSTGENPIGYDIELSADLNQAEVKSRRSFSVYSAAGKVQTITLEQVALYRRGENRWLFSPPENGQEFWGETETRNGRYLTISYPERDAAQVEPLLAYLEAKLDEMCTGLPDFSCPADLTIDVNLETVPGSQLRLLDEQTDLEFEAEISLPTLSLIGWPVDEAGAEALYRGYAGHVVRVAMLEALGVPCCGHALMIHALIDYEISELGLRPYPMLPGDYETIFGRFQDIGTLNEAWRSRETNLVDAEDWRWTYALTEFILSTSMSEKTAGQLFLSLDEGQGYLDWLNEILVVDVRDATLQQAWLNFIYGRSLSGQVAAASSKPDQEIVLRCNNISDPRSILYRFDWTTSGWEVLDQFEKETLFMRSVPDDSGIVLQQGDLDTTMSTVLWENGKEQILSSNENPNQTGYYFIGRMAPDGRELAMWNPNMEASPAVIKVDDCIEAGCRLELVSGLPNWSPDSSQIILEIVQQSEDVTAIMGLARIDEVGVFHQLSEQGGSPFWINDQEYGFVAREPVPGVYAAQISDDQPYILLAYEDLLQTLPEDIRPPDMLIRSAMTSPVDEDLFVIAAYGYDSRNSENVFLFEWNRLTEEISYLTEINQVVLGLSEFLPNGEWFLLPAYDQQLDSFNNASPWTFYLFNIDKDIPPVVLDGDQLSGFNGIDYSSDGDWILAAYPSYLELIHLGMNVGDNQPYRQLLSHDFNNCQQALFIW